MISVAERRCIGHRYVLQADASTGVPVSWVCACGATGKGWPAPHWYGQEDGNESNS